LHSPWGRHYYVSYLIFLDKPLFGHGLKSFREECKKYQQIVDKSCTTHPHNFHLEILNDGGIILYIIFIIAITNYMRVKNKLKKLNNEYLMYALMLVIFIFLPRPTGSLFSTTFGTMFWFLTAILLNNGLKKSE
jgi:O-antigen ligase